MIDSRQVALPSKTKVPLYATNAKFVGFGRVGSVQRLHDELAGILGVPAGRILLADSASNALYVQLTDFRSTHRGEVRIATPSYNCTSVIDAIDSADCVPVLYDIGLDVQPTQQAIEFIVAQKCQMVVWPNFYGTRLRNEEHLKLLKEQGVQILFDEAQSFPISYDAIQEQAKKYAYAVLFSFGRSKPVGGTGGGGLYMVSDQIASIGMQHDNFWHIFRQNKLYVRQVLEQKMCQRAPGMATKFGIHPDRQYVSLLERMEAQKPVLYTGHQPISSVSAQHALHNLQRIKKNVQHIEQHQAFVASLPGESTRFMQGVVGYPAIVALCVPAEKRYELSEELAQKGIQTRWYYQPLASISRYSTVASQAGELTEQVSGSILIVPFGRWHTKAQKEYVLEVLTSVL